MGFDKGIAAAVEQSIMQVVDTGKKSGRVGNTRYNFDSVEKRKQAFRDQIVNTTNAVIKDAEEKQVQRMTHSIASQIAPIGQVKNPELDRLNADLEATRRETARLEAEAKRNTEIQSAQSKRSLYQNSKHRKRSFGAGASLLSGSERGKQVKQADNQATSLATTLGG